MAGNFTYVTNTRSNIQLTQSLGSIQAQIAKLQTEEKKSGADFFHQMETSIKKDSLIRQATDYKRNMTQKVVDEYIGNNTKEFSVMMSNLAENPSYLYNCSVPFNQHSGTGNNLSNLMTFSLCSFSVILCVFIVATIFTNKKLKDIHPSKLIAVMAVSLICCTWHVGIWKVHTVYLVCYSDANRYYKWLYNLSPNGNHTMTDA